MPKTSRWTLVPRRTLPALSTVENRIFFAGQWCITGALMLLIMTSVALVATSIANLPPHPIIIGAFVVAVIAMIAGLVVDHRYRVRSIETWYAQRRIELDTKHDQRMARIAELRTALERAKSTGDPMTIDATSRRIFDELDTFYREIDLRTLRYGFDD